MKSLAEIFPRASKAFHEANPHLKGSMENDLELGRGPTSKNDVQPIVARSNAKRGVMNKTESEFSFILEGQKKAGEILRYEFEGITLRWADMRYTPDFVVFKSKTIEVELNSVQSTCIEVAPEIILIEVKGGYIWDRDIVRFKGARAYWPEFTFEMHQKTKNGWIRKF